MNKILTTALVLGALYGTANAIEIKPYVGLDAGYNKMDVKDVEYDGKSDSKKFNYGLNAGVKFELENNLFKVQQTQKSFSTMASVIPILAAVL